MSEKKNADKRPVQDHQGGVNQDSKAARQQNEKMIDEEVKEAAGRVQEELTPIRKSAGHAHNH
jgi:hypothetical protein